jgi:hypothetical protein
MYCKIIPKAPLRIILFHMSDKKILLPDIWLIYCKIIPKAGVREQNRAK